VDLLQSWMIVGVPAVALALGLFSGRNKLRAWIGYGVLAALVVFFVTVPRDVISAVAIGIVIVGFVATGRGTHTDDEFQEHHVDRKRFTTVRDDEPVGP
jgi:MFS superfamily sulfate permease-like transporter